MRPLMLLFWALLLIFVASAVLADPCEWPPPEPWDGIVPLPPACDPSYSGSFYIVAKPGYGLNGTATARDVALVVVPLTVPNEREFFTGEIFVRIGGYGNLAGFQRDLVIPVTGEFHFDPQDPADPVRSLECSIHSLQGQLVGDPDFDQLIITAGEASGLPSPGSTTLTELPGGDFNVDSFFDITYQIEFTGAPGSILEGLDDISIFTDRWRTGEEYIPVIEHSCQLPDNGTGAIDLPPACPDGYLGTLTVVDGLPPGTEISGPAVLRDIFVTAEGPGGSLGGEFQTFDAGLYWDAIGSGDLAGYYRTLYIPVSCETHTGPRNPGDPVQVFGSDLVAMQGQVVGDPDFDVLTVVAGENNGLPSPGSTSTTLLPNGNYAVDSFFDVYFTIEFTGAPGSPLEAMSGTTLGNHRFHAGEPYVVSAVGAPVASPLMVLHQNSPNPFNPMTVIRYQLPPGGGRVALDIFDLRGRHIRNLVDEVQAEGAQAVTWDGTDDRGQRTPSGVYFYKMKTDRETLVRKMAVLK